MTEKEYKAMELILQHKRSIAVLLAKFVAELAYRTAIHDNSKLSPGEFELSAEHSDEFNKYTWDSPEERQLRDKLAPAATLHRQRNRHHPEYFENGIDGMNLIDLLEMLSDWVSASERGPGDSIRKSLPILKEKYKISPQLYQILTNTVNDFKLY